MNYTQLAEHFLNEYPDYTDDLENFNEYLQLRWKNSLSDETLRVLLQGMDVEFLLEGLVYNVEKAKRYTTKASARQYASVVGQFFNFMKKKTDIENPGLYGMISLNRSRGNGYMRRMEAYIDRCGSLEGTAEAAALGRSQALVILQWADEQLEAEEYPGGALKKAMAAVGVKMMLAYGITYRELRKIRTDQYDDMRDAITINGFELRLPTHLAAQMKKVKAFLADRGIANREGLFFITDAAGQPWGELTSSSGIPDYIGTLTGSTSVTGVVKYGITQLIKAGIGDSVIRQITGASDRLLKSCVVREEDLEQTVNNKLVTVELYDKF